MWHPQQRLSHQPDGRVVLEVPFTDTRELAMDVLQHGRHMEVMEPQDLSKVVAEDLASALALYRCIK